MKVTVNEMLYKTLHTKITKEPKYKNVLEALGYELLDDHYLSSYDYWGVVAKDETVVVISKTRDGKKALFKTAKRVPTNDFTKVDLVNLINTVRPPYRNYYETWNTCKDRGRRKFYSKKIYEYHFNKHQINLENSILENYSKEEKELMRKLKDVRERKEKTEDKIKKYRKALDEVLGKI